MSLADDAIHELTTALAGSQTLDVKDSNTVTSLISAKVSSISSKDLRRIMATLLSLYSVRASAEVAVPDFVDDVIHAMTRSKRPGLSLHDPESERKFRSRLAQLLTVGSIAAASKAVVIQHEHEHTLCTSRIFTDARPVYGDDVSAPPSLATIIHMLKLAYHEGDITKEIHIALDKQDLIDLKEQIARAESKAASLQKVFELSHIPVIE